MILNRDQILSADDIKRETVPVPEWGGEVIVTTLSAAERDEYEQSLMVKSANGKTYEQNLSNARAKLAAYSVIDENGKRLFSTADIEALGAKGAPALSRVYDVAARLNRLSTQDVEELAKN